MRISLENAQELLRESIKPLPYARLALHEALGCIMAETVMAQIDQPPFPRSPYDGYALRAFDSVCATHLLPVELKIIGHSFAGKPSEVTVGVGEAVRIMTGGMIPLGADCVIAQEQTDGGEAHVKIYKELKPFENYCRLGEDFLSGTEIVPNGIPVTAAVLGVAASAGCTELSVFPKPHVTVFSTGDELQNPGQALGSGQIYSSNSVLLSARLKELGIPVAGNTCVRDDLTELMCVFEKANKSSDLIISTGGVSVGLHDLVPEALERLGAKIVFKGVDIKPGMPAIFAMLNGKPILALSGNPFACAVTFELLARPAIAVLSSDNRIELRREKAALTKDCVKKRLVRRFQRGILKYGAVSIPGEQGNGQLRTMIGCNCLAELPAGNESILAGSPVDVYMLEGEIYGI